MTKMGKTDCEFSETPLETAYGGEMNIQCPSNRFGCHSYCQLPSACSLNACAICGILLCDKITHFRVAFYCGQSKIQLYTNHGV